MFCINNITFDINWNFNVSACIQPYDFVDRRENFVQTSSWGFIGVLITNLKAAFGLKVDTQKVTMSMSKWRGGYRITGSIVQTWRNTRKCWKKFSPKHRLVWLFWVMSTNIYVLENSVVYRRLQWVFLSKDSGVLITDFTLLRLLESWQYIVQVAHSALHLN